MDAYRRIAERIVKSRLMRPTANDVAQVANILKEELSGLVAAAALIDVKLSTGAVLITFEEAANLKAELEKWRE